MPRAQLGDWQESLDIIAAIPAKGDKGELPCPRCKGKILWRRGPGRRQFRLKCETPNCVEMIG